MPVRRAPRVLVVGAGFAGLAAADALVRAGADAAVLEARERVGGRVWSTPFAGGVVERGAEFVFEEYELLRATAARLGLRLREKGMHYGAREPRGGIGTSLHEIEAALDALRSAPADQLAHGTLAGALDRLVPNPGAREAIRARIEVSTGYPADDLDAGVLAHGGAHFGDFATWTVEGGNQRIADGLAEGLGARLRLGAPVHEVAWDGDGVRAATPDGTLAADAAVIAVPGTVLTQIAFRPALPPATAAAVAALRFGHAAKLFLALRRPAPPSATLAVADRYWVWTELRADGSPAPVLASFAGTPDAAARLAADGTGAAWAAAIERLRPDLALDPRARLLATWSDDPWARGAYSARSHASPTDERALAAPAGRLAFAGEHTAGALHGLMEGALRSGERAAAEALRAARG